ncbi:hypothetical protein BGZ60DRAFT_435415 [Tricladium varicosporioides]|nr:hypothetical protein BGZ60DRAFT_435415 [Hymenoscyphus varicosporioides]
MQPVEARVDAVGHACKITGNADMYGLGIRLGFYLQWYISIIATWIARSEVRSMRISNLLFVAATFLALVIQTARESLNSVEIYVILLLAFGGYLSLVPLYLWRIMTGCVPKLDPSRYPSVRNGPLFSALSFVLLFAVSSFQLWFWSSRVRQPDTNGCPQYGFFFTKLRLDSKGLITTNLVFYCLLLTSCFAILIATALKFFKIIEEPTRPKISRNYKTKLLIVQSALNTIVTTTVVVATELTISWNSIVGVWEISSAGQLIPVILGIGLTCQVLYIGFFGAKESEESGGPEGPEGLSGNSDSESLYAVDLTEISDSRCDNDLFGDPHVVDSIRGHEIPGLRTSAYSPLH